MNMAEMMESSSPPPTIAKRSARLLCLFGAVGGTSMVVASLFFPYYLSWVGTYKLPVVKAIDSVQSDHAYSYLLPALVGVLGVLVMLWAFRSERARWWLTGLAGAHLFQGVNTAITMGVILTGPHTLLTMVPAAGTYLRLVGNLLAGLSLALATRLVPRTARR